MTAKILIVEDVSLEGERVKDLLLEQGYLVDLIQDGETALRHLDGTAHVPDLVITDVVMPGMDGFELCRRIKQQQALETIPVMLLTGLHEPTDVIKGLQCGASNFIHKPYDEHFFLERIRSVLETQRFRLQAQSDVKSVHYAGKEYRFECDDNQVLDLLLSTYEHSYRQNVELMATRDELRKANKRLEEVVDQRTEDLYESEKNRLLSEGLINSICASDFLILLTLGKSGTIIRANNAAARFFDRSKEQLEGVCLDDLEGGDSAFKQRLRECLKSGTEVSEIDFSLETSSRGLVWGCATISNAHSVVDSSESVFVIIRDITARKNSEEALETSRHELVETLDQLAEAITKVTNLQNFDVRIELPKHPPCHEVNNCSNEQCPQYGSKSYRCWKMDGSGFVVCSDSLEGYCRNDIASCAYYHTIMSEPLNNIQELFNCMMDILQAGHQQLEDAYLELSNTRAQSLQQEKMASIGQLAAGVAHEINNPVGFISSNLATLTKYIARFETFFSDVKGKLENQSSVQLYDELMMSYEANKIRSIMADLPKLAAECLDGTDRVTRIVNDLKSFSRTDDETMDHVDINACIDSTLNIVWNEIKYCANLVKDYGELPRLYANGHKLGQVFMNLIMNAAHAIEDQGEITIRTRYDDKNVVVAIGDNGCGMSREVQEKIFEPFYTTKEVGKGTGLGMSVVYEILQKHNATIDLASTVGQGTCFTLSFPSVKE